MGNSLGPDLEACKNCKVGSCCYEGAELTEKELLKIIKHNPKAAKPWFRLVERHEQREETHPFTTIVRGGTCIFQDKANRCMVYRVRPQHCRDFPLENGKTAPYYKRLCVLFHEQWAPNSQLKRTLKRREKGRFL